MASLEWMASPRTPRTATVIFIHGLGGHGYNTWRRTPADKPWPIWLAEQIKGVAVGTISYEASPSGWRGTSLSLEERAKTLFPLLKSTLANSKGPIVFVCHSLGGLVLKQLVVMAASGLTFGREGEALLRRVEGVAFYATPHGGSRYGNLADQLKFFVWPTPTMQCLSQGGPQVHLLNEQYRNWAAANPAVKHLILYETQRSIFGWIVKARDADPGIPNAEMQPGEANHFTICKPFGRGDARYTLCRELVTSIVRRDAPDLDLTPDSANPPLVPDPLPSLPPREPVVVPHLVLRMLIVLAVCYVGYRGILSVYDDPFRLRLQQSFESKGLTPQDSREISSKIASDAKERKIGEETLQHFLDRGDLQLTGDPAVIYKNFLTLANKYSELEGRLKNLADSKNPDVQALSSQGTSALKQGNIASAEMLAKAAELRRQLQSQAEFRKKDSPPDWIEFTNNWDKDNIAVVDIPQLAAVGDGTTGIKFYKPAANQLQAAFDELQKAGLMNQIHEWCGSYAPRLIRGSTTILSNHALGTSFDINCTELPLGRPMQLSDRPDFAKVVDIFQKHGFVWGGYFGRPDPMHFEIYRIIP
jgi:pimeloyl-ACP methyl ester carboxylesterase